MKQLFAIVTYYLFGYLIFWTFLHETNLFPKIWVEQNFTIAIYLWVFFFIVPLFLIAISTDYIKSRIKDFKSLNQNTRWPLYIFIIWSMGSYDWICIFTIFLF